MSATTPVPHMALTALDRSDGEGPSQLLDWVPKTPFRLASSPGEGVPEDPDAYNSCMPWEAWGMDRALVWLPEEAMIQDRSDAAAVACTEAAHCYSFDGEIAFIPSAHAETFWSFLQAYFTASAKSDPSFLFEGQPVALTEADWLILGDTATGVWGMRTEKGLWLVFSESDASFGTPFLSQAIQAYPRAAELSLVDASALRQASDPVSVFDPTRAWAVVDCHLADNLGPDRATTQASYPAFFALLAGAIGDGALPPAHLVVDLGVLVESQIAPWTGERIALADGGLTASAKTWTKLVEALGAAVVPVESGTATRVLAGPRDTLTRAAALAQGAVIIEEADVIRAVLDAHGQRLEAEHNLLSQADPHRCP